MRRALHAEINAITLRAQPTPAAVTPTQQQALVAHQQAEAAFQAAQASYAEFENQRATLQQQLARAWDDREAARLALRFALGTVAGTPAALGTTPEAFTGGQRSKSA